MKQRQNYKEISIDTLFDIIGSFALAIGIYYFAEKANIAPGGVSGIAILIKYLWGLPIGTMTLVINIPIIYLASRYLGKKFTFKTLRTLIISSLILDYVVTPYFPQYAGDRMLGAIFGGVCMGFGLGVIFYRGSTTAGTDIISCLIERKFPHVQIGSALMLVDCIILGLSIIVFGNIESGLFGMVALFCQTKVIDGMIYGLDKGRQVVIMSDKNEVIAGRVIEEMERSATFIKGQGAYSQKDALVLLCVVRIQEYHQLKTIVYNEDPTAFMIVTEADQVLGEGFKPITKQR